MFLGTWVATLMVLQAAAAGDTAVQFGPPTPEMRSVMARSHHPRDWLRVRLPERSLVIRAAALGEDGLPVIDTWRTPDAPTLVPWTRIERIDRLRWLKRGAQIRGFFFGALAGGLAPLAVDQADSKWPTVGAVGGALAGSWLLGTLEDRMEPRGALYVAKRPAPQLAGAPPDPLPETRRPGSDETPRETAAGSSAAAPNEPGPIHPAEPAGRMPADPEIVAACRRVHSGDVLRVDGDFGRVLGVADSVTTESIAGIHGASGEEPARELDHISWERIMRVDRRSNQAGRYALSGAIGLGAVGLLIGFVGGLASVAAGTGDDVGLPTLGGAMAGAAAGGALGGLTGSLITRWDPVYLRDPGTASGDR